MEINGEIPAEKKHSATKLYKDWELPVTNLPILITDSLITDYLHYERRKQPRNYRVFAIDRR
jgi:hypothetical protein